MRLPRYVVPGQPQHVMQRGNNRSAIFAEEADFVVYREFLSAAAERNGSVVHAYVLMTNHVHVLMTPHHANSIGNVMKSIDQRYAQYFNRKRGRTGTLWEGRYRATLIDSEQYLLTCYRYIELNPVRAGLVAHASQYRWSSYGANALGYPDSLVSPHERYLALGATENGRRRTYRALFKNELDGQVLGEIRDATNNAWALGSRFAGDAKVQLNRRACRSSTRSKRAAKSV